LGPQDEEQATLLQDATLPPLPTPNHDVRRRQNAVGCTTVLLLCAFFLSSSWFLLQAAPRQLRLVLLACLTVEALIAVACLAGLYWSDPGVMTRDPSLPIPEEVTRCLQVGEALPTKNIEASGGSFCVRCMVWRRTPADEVTPEEASRAAALLRRCRPQQRPAAAAHHCSVCQRCVAHFSHHCSFFGRCIAGRGLEGNYKYFVIIISIGWTANLTYAGVVSTYLAATRETFWHAAFPTLLVLYVAYYLFSGGLMLILSLCRFAVLRHCPALACEADPPEMPPEPMIVALIGPCCGSYLPVSC